MSETILKIENPKTTIKHGKGWSDYKEHARKVVALFPKEYRIVSDTEGSLIVLNLPMSEAGRAIAKDQLIHLSPRISVGEIDAMITNENNQISSYTELERDKASLDVFIKLTIKSVSGTLESAVDKIRKPKVDPTQAIIQVIILVVALIAIFMGLKALL